MKKKKESWTRKEVMIPLFIAFIMIMSTMGYMWGSDSASSLKYNGYDFARMENGKFSVEINKTRFMFNYYPEEIEWINVSKSAASIGNFQMLYVAYDPKSEYAEGIAQIQFELGQLLWDMKGTYVQNAFTSESEYPNIPVVGCANATFYSPVLIIEQSNSTSTEDAGGVNCFALYFKNRQELAMAYERLVYAVLGVMK